MKNRKKCRWPTYLAVLLVLALRPVLGFEVGVLGGLTFSRFSSPDLSWKYRPAYSVGAFANFQLNRFLRLQPELRVTAVRSVAVIPMRYYYSYKEDVQLFKTVQWVEVPVLLHFAPFIRGSIRPNLQLGAYGAVIVHGEDRLEFADQCHAEDIRDELKHFHAGFLAGAGIDFRIGRILLHLSGLWRIALNPLAVNYPQQDIKSTGFMISLGLGLWYPGEDARSTRR